jgi:hypothetical protein
MSLKNSNDNIGNGTRDLPVCSVVPSPLRHRTPPVYDMTVTFWSICFSSLVNMSLEDVRQLLSEKLCFY